MTEKIWRFVSNNHASDDGINDAGIETFSSNKEESNIRESIQNALDQKSHEFIYNNEPVIVEFDDFYIESNKFPDKKQFKEILNKCIKSSVGNKATEDYFKKSLTILDQNIKVLRISDFNTTGLEGAESDDRNQSWHNLVKSKGNSNKNMDAGGSFGIGKSAAFACSGLRTVFYGSKVGNIYSYIGVARLISHEETNGLTVGTGYFSENQLLKAILEPFEISKYKRDLNGTDIFIMGYDGNNDIEKIIRETTLTNFFVSIHKGLLEIRYKELKINKDNLGQYIAALDENEFFNTKIYYELLCSFPSEDNPNVKRIVLNSKEYGEKYGIGDGEATLLLKKDDNLNRSVLMTRKPGMSLFLQKGISSSISFTGLLLIEGETMNGLFKSMEVPAHDKWMPERCRDNKEMYINAYTDLKKYIKKKVVDNFGQTNDDVISAYGMEEFFYDTKENDGNVEANVLEGAIDTKIKKYKVNKRNKDMVITNKRNTENGGKPQNPVVSPNEIKAKSKYEYKDLKKRLFCRNEKKGEYSINFKVGDYKRICLEFFGIAEKGHYPLPLLDACVINLSFTGNTQISNNNMYLDSVTENSDITIDFKIGFDYKCMMEVNYYEVK